MTIGTAGARVNLNCDGSSKVFPVPIQGYLATDFDVYLTAPASAGGAQTLLVLNSDYNLAPSGTLNPTQWTLTTLATVAYALGYTIGIFINPDQVQQSQYVQGQAFPSLAIQTNLDRLTQMVQRLQDEINRCVRVPDGDVSPAMLLPIAQLRFNQALMCDAGGNIAMGVPITQTLTQSLFNSFLPGATIATSASGVPIGGGSSVMTPDDLANSPVLPIPFSQYGTGADLFIINYAVDSAGSAIQGRLNMGGTGNGQTTMAAGVLGFNTPATTPPGSGLYGTNFGLGFGYTALLTDGPSLLRGNAVDVCLGLLATGPGTAIQGQGFLAGVKKTAGAFAGFNTTPGINSALWVKSYDTTNYLACESEAGNWRLTGGLGDLFTATNGGVGTSVQGQQNAGAKGVLGLNDGTKNVGVYGSDNGNSANYAAYFDGKGFIASAWTVSDERLKRNIVEVPTALKDIQALRVVEYDKLRMPAHLYDEAGHMTGEFAEIDESKVLVHEVGIIAQELQTIMPSAVDSGGQFLAVNDREVLYRLVRAVQELAEKIK